MKLLVIGLGPMSIGFLHRLKELTLSSDINESIIDLTIVEKSSKIGGLSSSIIKNGYTWDYGGHLFYSHYHYFDEILEKLEKNGSLIKKYRNSQILFNGVLIPYPFQSNIHLLDKDIARRMLKGMKNRETNIEKPVNMKDWGISNFGKDVYDLFFEPQNNKSMNIDLEKLGTYWVGDRVPMPDLDEIEKKIEHDEGVQITWGSNSTFFISKNEGTQGIWENIFNKLGYVVNLNSTAKIISIQDGINCSISSYDEIQTKKYDIVVNSSPIDDMIAEIVDIPIDKSLDSKKLEWNKLVVIGIGIKGIIPKCMENVSWIYIPEKRYKPYRFSVFSNYSSLNAPDGSFSLLFESSFNKEDEIDEINEISIKNDCINLAKETGFITLDNKIEEIFILPQTRNYPIPTIERDNYLNNIIPFLNEKGIYSRGRFGGWKYEIGNMDHSFMQGVELCDKIFKNQNEITWNDPIVINGH